MRQAIKYKNKLTQSIFAVFVGLTAVFAAPALPASAAFYCGEGEQKVEISVDIGCRGEGGGIKNPITDAVFAIIRFLSVGVGLVIVASLTYAGIQYTSSRGDPKATAEAIGRIRSNIIAFLLFLFSFALLSYVIPKGFIG